MPAHRIFAPDIEVLGRAALLSGILCRVQRYDKDSKLRALQDLCAVPAGAEAWAGRAHRECQRLRQSERPSRLGIASFVAVEQDPPRRDELEQDVGGDT